MASSTLTLHLIIAAALISVSLKSNAKPPGSGRIVGGLDAKPGEFPWHVSFQFYLNETEDKPAWVHKYGGTLIDHRHVLTAAHCTHLNTPEWLRKTRIVLGAWNISDETESSRLVRTPCRYTIHPNYNYWNGTINMDITVITWKKPVTYSKYVQPLRLASVDADPLGTTCVITGWGIVDTQDQFSLPEILKIANQTIITNEECAERLDGNSPTNRPILVTDICGIDITGGNQTACRADSGGPLTCYDVEGPYLAGVTGYGGCNMPKNKTEVVAIRVSKLLNFITCKRGRKG